LIFLFFPADWFKYPVIQAYYRRTGLKFWKGGLNGNCYRAGASSEGFGKAG
jgi:hypothetical protein